MRYLGPLLLSLFGVLSFSPSAVSQCTEGSVRVTGRIENLAGGRARIDVTVLLKKGETKSTSMVTGPDFSIEVPFSTFRSYFFLWGHRCDNAPISVMVKVISSGKKPVLENSTIKDNFRMDGALHYTLWKNLVVRLEDEDSDGRPKSKLAP